MNILRVPIRRLSRLPKELSGPFPSSYNVEEVESHWYDWWESSKLFSPSKDSTKTFSLLLPPPNVTGTLHLGHALTVTIQDTLCRWHRMRGSRVLWIPGSDHAGIATQVVVEKYLKASSGQSRSSMSRQDFVEQIELWKNQKEGAILKQLCSLGASLDWNKEYFTLDSERSHAVCEAFLRLYDKGLIYRGNFLVNLSCSLSSTISDIEIDWIDIKGKTNISVPGYEKPIPFGIMYDVAYKLMDGTDEIIVSTTRPETIPGDVAVAVNPHDDRYSQYIGSRLRHPLYPDVSLPIIADEYVSIDVGTGALKITPGHDQNDYDIGKKHELPILNILDHRGHLVCPSDPDVHGLPRFTARQVIIKKLESSGLLKGLSTEHAMKLPKCSRSGDIVEKVIKPQWFIKTKDMYTRAKNLVEDSSLDISPNQFKKIWTRWLSNEMDWCISRQLWWGHRIPMWHCIFADGSQDWVPGRTEEEARSRVKNKDLTSIDQDPDVLDTWFSSALLPLSSLDWPSTGSNDLQKYYPLSLMETGHDILFFWVARMVMLCTELSDRPPFNSVTLHGLICDAQGRKMSKSLGNVVDPYHVIRGITLPDMISNIQTNVKWGHISKTEADKAVKGLKKDFPKGIPKIGTDGLRFGLLSYDVQGEMINLDINLIQSSGAFCNKIWQMSRFFMMATERSETKEKIGSSSPLQIEDKWILSCTARAVQSVNSALEENNFLGATRALRAFLYGQVCDVYLELSKETLSNPSHPGFDAKIQMMEKLILTGMSLIHPFCPFISEEIYQRINRELYPEKEISSIMELSYPDPKEWGRNVNDELEEQMKHTLLIVTSIRTSKQFYSLSKKDKPSAVIYTETPQLLLDFKDIIQTLGHIGDLTISHHSSYDETAEDWSKNTITETGDVVCLECSLNLDKELRRIEEREVILRRNEAKYKSRLQNRKAGEKTQIKLNSIVKEMEELESQRKHFESLLSKKQQS